jgi:orotidine-5'-phosphate decarboxylase
MTELIVALDVPTDDEAWNIISTLGGKQTYYKIGLELFSYPYVGALINDMRDMGLKIFLDLKLHDIPPTVEKTVRNICNHIQPDMLTIDIIDIESLLAAQSGRGVSNTKLIGVGPLTTQKIYKSALLEKYKIAKHISDGIVGSAAFCKELRESDDSYDREVIVVTPGVRLLSDNTGDHRIVSRPEDAVAAGVNYVVVGGPIINGVTNAHQRYLDDLVVDKQPEL